MDKLYVLGGILGVISCCRASNIGGPMSRSNRDVTADGVSGDDVTMIRVSTLLESLDVLDDLSAQDIRATLGNTDSYATVKLKEISSILQTLSMGDSEMTSQTASLMTRIGTLGFLIGLDMQLEESRRLSIQGITIYISKYERSRFRGLYFSSNDGNNAISIPQSLSFPQSIHDVTSVSYSVSGISRDLYGTSNITVGSDVIATAFLDTDGDDLALTFRDLVLVNIKLDSVPVDKQPICAYLKQGEWSSTGCDTVYPTTYGDTVVECKCDHLSIFAVLLDDKPYKPRLGVAAMIGSCFTILFCLITVLVFIGYRLMHSIRCYIRFSFLTALTLAEIMYLCIRYTEAPAICTLVAAGSHFFSLASFTWMLSYALFLGNEIIGQMEESLHVTHYTFLGWAIPFAVVLISYIWRYDSYVHEQYCWISDKRGLPYAFVLPICFVIVITLCVLLYDIAVYVSVKDPKKTIILNVARSGLRSCCCLLPVLSAVWLMAHFMVNIGYLWLQIVFSSLNFILGVMLFLSMFVLNEEVLMKRSNKTLNLKKFWVKRFGYPRSKKSKEPGDKKSMGMTMIWRGFSKPSTSAEGQGSHPYTESVELGQRSCAEGYGSDVEGHGSVTEGYDSPRFLTTLHPAPIASSEDSLLTRDSVDPMGYPHDVTDEGGDTGHGDLGRTSRMALLPETQT